MNDFNIIKLWTENVKPDLPYSRLLLRDIGGIPENEVEEILAKITPEILYELLKDDI